MQANSRLDSYTNQIATPFTKLKSSLGGRRHHNCRSRLHPVASIFRANDKLVSPGKDDQVITESQLRNGANLSSTPSTTTVVDEEACTPIWRNVWKSIAKAATVGALCLAMAVACASPALAARSGGRIGGSSFHSGSMGGPSISRSYGHTGLGGSSMFGGSMAGPSVYGSMRSHSSSFGFFGPPAPFYGGGYGYGVPVQSGGGSGIGGLILFGILAAVLFSVFSGGIGGDGLGDVDEAVTVVKLQVGLLGTARELKRDLERIAGRADTNTPDGLHFILQETVLSLLRNPDYAVYGAATTSKQRGLEKGESKFNRMSMEERGKIKEETMVNYDGRSRRSSYSGSSASRSPGNDLIVVTILAAIDDRVNLPKVTSGEELREALNVLGSVGSEQVLACEVLWTPQDENDHYTRDDIIHDYPTLNNL